MTIPKSFHLWLRLFCTLTWSPTLNGQTPASLRSLLYSMYLSAACCLASEAFFMSVGLLATWSGIGRAVLGLLARNIWAGE